MINRSELKKGNKVAVSSQYVTVEQAFEETILVELPSGETVFFYFENIDPIPLTSKMLTEQLGYGRLFGEKSSSYLNGHFLLDQSDGRFLSIPHAEPIYYVHQLQNVYLKLMGSELGVNLLT